MKSLLIIVLGLFGLWVSAWAAEPVPYELQEVRIEEHLGETISLDREFIDESGQTVSLQSFFNGTNPVILNLVYYECPNLCNFLLNGLTKALSQLEWTAGDQFQIVTISIDPAEDATLARQKKETYLHRLYQRPEAADGWHFLTGSEKNIGLLAEELGFYYRYDEEQDQYAHAAAIYILTPGGEISRYLYGIEFNPRDIRLALLEASEGKIGNAVDKLLLFCYHYDPKGRKYSLFALRLMKLGGAIAVLGLGFLIVYLGIRHRRGEHASTA